jgi:hypothetical protein
VALSEFAELVEKARKVASAVGRTVPLPTQLSAAAL